jgi:hypothetical protein
MTDCAARIKAAEYLNNRAEITAHLIADSYCPAHWYSLESACHSKFESDVNSHIKVIGEPENFTVDNFVVNETCIDKDTGAEVELYADNAYLLEVANAIRAEFGVAIVTMNFTPNITNSKWWQNPTPKPSSNATILNTTAIPKISAPPDWKSLSVLGLILIGLSITFILIYFVTKREE